jgi:hypothetical protein
MIPDRQVSTTRSGPDTRNIGAAIAGIVSLARQVSLLNVIHPIVMLRRL